MYKALRGVAPLALLLVLPASAQVPYLAAGNQEANVFGGLSYGLDRWRGSWGGNYAFAIHKYVMLYGEYSYVPGIARDFPDITNSEGAVIFRGGDSSFRFDDFHGGVHIRLPVFPEKRIVPYLSGGVGVLHADGDVTFEQIQNGVFTGATEVRSFSSTTLAFNGGGGLRLYLSGDGRFGMRFEAKTYRPVSDISGTHFGRELTSQAAVFGKITIGFFYQFR